MTTSEMLTGLQMKADSGNSFAASLLAGYAKYKGFTPRQMPWAEKLAREALNPIVPENLGGDLSAITTKFKTARANGLKRPALLFFNVGKFAPKLKITLAPDTGKNPGALYVKAGYDYMGKVTPDGALVPSRAMNDDIKTFLKAFAADPVSVSAANGKAAGSCCYCAHELTDARSLNAGYGPVCAKHWGLPWGEVELKEAA